MRQKNEGSSAFDDRELAQHGWTVQRAIRFALEHLRKQSASLPLGEVITRLEASKLASGKSSYYCRLMRQRLEKMTPTMGKRPIAEITASDIEDFLNSLEVSPSTRNTVRRDCVTLWSYAVKQRLASSNEAQKVDVSQTVDAPPAIFSPKQAADLLAASEGDVLAFHALGLFAGLRVAEIKRLDWQDVDLEGGFVHVSAKNSKTRSRRLIPVLPALRAWITPVAKSEGAIIEKNFQKRQLATRAAAKLTEWPENGLRHSFVSYRLADTNDAGKTALEAGHDQDVLFKHYRELVKSKDAKKYFGIRPVDGKKIIPLPVAA
ncbi:MAG: tyrosine-type recombinase/integrase [Terrimicrobiaceae bacterium]